MSWKKVKKLVSILTISTSVTKDSKEVILASAKDLKQIMCIQYSIIYPSYKTQDGSVLDSILALFDSGSKLNVMHLAFAEKLGLVVKFINVGTQKIDSTTFEIYGMVVAVFSVTDQANKIRFFKETFLMANISSDVLLEIFFFILSSANIDFLKREFW